MAINFPSSPSLNDVYTSGDRTWTWNGAAWKAKTTPQIIKAVPVNPQSGTSYTLTLSDAGKRVSMTNAGANSAEIPPNASVAFDVGTIVFVSQDGDGATSITAGSGVTINTSEGLKVGGRYRMISLINTATDVWMALGTVA